MKPVLTIAFFVLPALAFCQIKVGKAEQEEISKKILETKAASSSKGILAIDMGSLPLQSVKLQIKCVGMTQDASAEFYCSLTLATGLTAKNMVMNELIAKNEKQFFNNNEGQGKGDHAPGAVYIYVPAKATYDVPIKNACTMKEFDAVASLKDVNNPGNTKRANIGIVVTGVKLPAHKNDYFTFSGWVQFKFGTGAKVMYEYLKFPMHTYNIPNGNFNLYFSTKDLVGGGPEFPVDPAPASPVIH